MDLPDRLRSELVARAAEAPRVLRLWLFGSRARGDAGPRADVDLAVEAPGATPGEWARVAAGLREPEGTLLKVDVVRLDAAPEPLRRRILDEGVVLYDRGQGAAAAR